RRRGLLLGPIVAGELNDAAGAFARFVEPSAILEAEREALAGLAREVERGGYPSLAWLLRQPAQPGQSLIVVAVRFFFRREVEADAELARRLSLGQVEQMTRVQEEVAADLRNLCAQVAEVLGHLAAKSETRKPKS